MKKHVLILLTFNLLSASPLFEAIESNDYKSVETLLRNGSDPYEHRRNSTSNGNASADNAICYVAANSNKKMLEIFIPFLQAIDKPCPTVYTTPLMSAAGAGNIANMKFLLSKGANINAKQEYSYHSSVLMYAIEANRTDAAKFLIQNGADINYIGTYDFTPLSTAVAKNNFNIMVYLIENGVDIKGLPGFAAMKYAVKPLKYDYAKFLIDHGVNLAFSDQHGNTILHLLASGIVDKNLQAMKSTLEHPRKGFPKSYYDMIQKQVDSIDKRWGDYSKIIQYIIAHGGNPRTKNNEGKTTIDLAKENHTDVFLQTVGQ